MTEAALSYQDITRHALNTCGLTVDQARQIWTETHIDGEEHGSRKRLDRYLGAVNQAAATKRFSSGAEDQQPPKSTEPSSEQPTPETESHSQSLSKSTEPNGGDGSGVEKKSEEPITSHSTESPTGTAQCGEATQSSLEFEVEEAPPDEAMTDEDQRADWLVMQSEEYLSWYANQDAETQSLEWEMAKLTLSQSSEAMNAESADESAASTSLAQHASDVSGSVGETSSDPKEEGAESSEQAAQSVEESPAQTHDTAGTPTQASEPKQLPAPVLSVGDALKLLGHHSDEIVIRVEMGKDAEGKPLFVDRRYPVDGFCIDSPEKALWFGMKMRQAQLQFEEVVATAGAILNEYKQGMEQLWYGLGGQMRQYCEPLVPVYKKDVVDQESGEVKHKAGDVKGPKKLKFLGPAGSFAVFFKKVGGIRKASGWKLREWGRNLSQEEFDAWGFTWEVKEPSIEKLKEMIAAGHPLPPGVELIPEHELGFMGLGAADKKSAWTLKSVRDRFTAAISRLQLKQEETIDNDDELPELGEAA